MRERRTEPPEGRAEALTSTCEGSGTPIKLRRLMGDVQIIFTVGCAAFVAGLLWAERNDDQRLRWLTKPAASACFIALAVSLGALETSFGQAILVALIFSALGDILLIPDSRATFLAGMAAFALAHGAYAVAFVMSATAINGPFLMMSGAMVIFSLAVMRWLWPHLAEMRWPVAVYAAVIGCMVAASPLAVVKGNSPSMLVVAAALTFAISDLAVARQQFVTRTFFNPLWGLPLYYGAQVAFAYSV